MLLRLRAATVAVSVCLGGCSFGLNTHSPTVPGDVEPRCTTSRTKPVLDLLTAGTLLLVAASLDEGRAPLLIGAAGFGSLSTYGFVKTRNCRELRAKWEDDDSLPREPAVAPASPKSNPGQPWLQPAIAGPPETTAEGMEPITQPKVPAKNTCNAGGACPDGSTCDPLRHLCVAPDSPGLDGSRCEASRDCDDGLYCDQDSNRCRPGRVGRGGGPCHPAGNCDRGFRCGNNICVRNAQPRPGL